MTCSTLCIWGKLGIHFSSNKVQMIEHCTYTPIAASLETSLPVKSPLNVPPGGWVLKRVDLAHLLLVF